MAGLQNLERELEMKRNFIFTETARYHASQLKFHEASVLLEKIDGPGSDDDFSRSLLLVECFVQLGREIKAGRTASRIQSTLCGAPTPDCEVLKTLADAFGGISNCVKTLLIRKVTTEIFRSADQQSSEEAFSGIAANLHACNTTVREIIKGTNEASNLANLASSLLKKEDDDDHESTGLKAPAIKTENKLRLFTIAMDYGIEFMKDMYIILRRMPGVDWRKRAKDLASCANAIGYLYCQAGDNKKSIKWRKDGIKVMDDQYGSSASSYNLYGDLHHNIGVCFYNLDRYAEAKEIYMKAIDSYQKATDYGSETQRETDLKQSRSDLKDTKDHL